MSDGESVSDNSQPPALEDADLDDVSSGASMVSDSSASVSINTDDEVSDDDDSYVNQHQSTASFGATFVVALKDNAENESKALDTSFRRRRSAEDRNAALERNSLRRQESNSMLAAMRAAATSVQGSEMEDAPFDEPRRRPPPRTKSGVVLQETEANEIDGDIPLGGEGPRRRPPPRTKSGEGMPGGAPPHRLPPSRTKSGGEGIFGKPPMNGGDYENEDPDVMVVSSPTRRGSRRGDRNGDRDEALTRNAVRRQASSDMLRAMQASTTEGRVAPSSAKSTSAATQRRTPPSRTKSGEGLALGGGGGGEGDGQPPRRRPPPRTKSGEGMQDIDPNAPRRRPPPRTKSGGVFASELPSIIDEE